MLLCGWLLLGVLIAVDALLFPVGIFVSGSFSGCTSIGSIANCCAVNSPIFGNFLCTFTYFCNHLFMCTRRLVATGGQRLIGSVFGVEIVAKNVVRSAVILSSVAYKKSLTVSNSCAVSRIYVVTGFSV